MKYPGSDPNDGDRTAVREGRMETPTRWGSEETIFALSTAPGTAGVAVIRLSGPEAGPALDAMTGRARPEPRMATVAKIRDPLDDMLIDEGLVLWFPGPSSFTGEDCAELHCHGGRAILDAVLASLNGLPGLRPADAGEFTRRAVLNGKMDLTQAEGLLDLIQAETEAQRRQAQEQSAGALSRLYNGWRDRLVRLLAHAEAEIDFPDEGDAPDRALEGLSAEIRSLRTDIVRHLDDKGRGERLRSGLNVALIGAPNVGKSTLLNVLAGRDVAIVSPEAGTTRDILDVPLDLGGVPVTISDMAGLRESGNVIEREGIRRAKARATTADFRIAVFDLSTREPIREAVVAHLQDGDFVLLNKTDLVPSRTVEHLLRSLQPFSQRVFAVSATQGDGIPHFEAALRDMAVSMVGSWEEPALTRQRHRQALRECLRHLDQLLLATLDAPELMAEDLRLAMRALGRITGAVDVEDLLDVVFRDFCIGK